MTPPSWVAPRAWLSFIKLDKAVVLVWLDWLVFCEYAFSVFALWCPLATPTILLGFLLPWTWGISSRLLQQSTTIAPYLGWGVSPHRRPSGPSTWDSSSRPSCARTAGVGLVLLATAPDDHYIYYCGQESLRRNGVAIIVKKESKMQYFDAVSIMTEWPLFISSFLPPLLSLSLYWSLVDIYTTLLFS